MTNVLIQRYVVRADLSYNMADSLIQDMKMAIEYLEKNTREEAPGKQKTGAGLHPLSREFLRVWLQGKREQALFVSWQRSVVCSQHKTRFCFAAGMPRSRIPYQEKEYGKGFLFPRR